MTNKKTGIDLMREPFPAHLISKLPKPTKQQTEEVRADYKKGIRCKICGGWHHKDAIHFDYVGHAALTDRLLDCDPLWSWDPVSLNQNGTPLIEENGGLWIKLTVCGVTRLGYGHPDSKTGGDAIKEAIGDALRNAAMRFGAALDLWHKGGDLHAETTDAALPKPQERTEKPKERQPIELDGDALFIANAMNSASSEKVLKQIGTVRKSDIEKMPDDVRTELKLVYSRRLADLQNLTMAG